MQILLGLCFTFTIIYGHSSATGMTGNGNMDTANDQTQETAMFKTEIADLKMRLKDTDEQIKELREILEHKECRCDNRKLAPRAIGDETATLAFYAWLENHMSDIGIGMTVIFDTVITNIGGRYNGKTGIFYCDKPGLYFFSVTAMTHQGKYIELAMVVNGAAYMVVLADAKGSGDYETGSNSGVIELQNGDSVWVRVKNHVIGDTDNIIYAGWTTFTGYFLKEIS